MFGIIKRLVAQLIKGLVHRVKWVLFAGEDPVFHNFVEILGQSETAVGLHFAELAAGEELLYGHPVLRKRPGFIDAQNSRGPQDFDRGHPSCQYPFAGDAPSTQRKEYGENNGEFFGQNRHRQGNARQNAFEPFASG